MQNRANIMGCPGYQVNERFHQTYEKLLNRIMAGLSIRRESLFGNSATT